MHRRNPTRIRYQNRSLEVDTDEMSETHGNQRRKTKIFLYNKTTKKIPRNRQLISQYPL